MIIKEIIGSEKFIGKNIKVNGWVNTHRKQKEVIFISLNDGSTVKCLQVVLLYSEADKTTYEEKINKLTKGVSLSISGQIIKSPSKGQLVELSSELEHVEILGTVDVDNYPMSKKRHSLEYVRKFPHLKMRTNIGAMVARMRNTCSFATHQFFQDQQFINVQTPLITSNDCEGGD